MRGRTWVNPYLSAVRYYQHVIFLPHTKLYASHLGICRGNPTSIGAVCGKNTRWIAVSAVSISINNGGQIASTSSTSTIFINGDDFAATPQQYMGLYVTSARTRG